MKVIIAGGRDFDDEKLLYEKCMYYLWGCTERQEEVVVLCGMARGADMIGYKYAKMKGYCVLEYPALWDAYGKRAGLRRNIEMAENAHALIAFWDGKSTGTAHMIEEARKRGLKVAVVKYSKKNLAN